MKSWVLDATRWLARENLLLVLPRRGLLVAQIDVGKQLRLLETRREIERLICRSAARRASAGERLRFGQLAGEFLRAAARNDDMSFIRADRAFNELCLAAALLVSALQAGGRPAGDGPVARCAGRGNRAGPGGRRGRRPATG